MTYTINAWLDCCNPYITVSNRKTGEMLAYFNPHEIDKIFSSGDLILEDFQLRDEDSIRDIAEDLLFIKWSRNTKEQIDDIQAELLLKRGVIGKMLNSKKIQQDAMGLIFPRGLLALNYH